jgi:polysaccharide export outer membrane protein
MPFETRRQGQTIFINIVAFLLIGSFASCVNTQKATYFNSLKDMKIDSGARVPEPVIQKNDILNIAVSSLNPDATAIFNMAPTVNTNSGTQLNGYLVSDDGFIQFPVLGNIKAAGLTKNELKQFITKSLLDKKQLVDPIVSVRFINFKVTVLGEVKNPTVINVPNEKISLLEAIGLAGDLTIYAKRDNVLVIREEGESKVIKRLNLNSNELFSSPYYYLKANDVVYAEPNKSKVATTSRATIWLPVVFSALSLGAIVLDRVLE